MPTRDEMASHAAWQDTPRQLKKIATQLERQNDLAEWEALCLGAGPTRPSRMRITRRVAELEDKLWPKDDDGA